MMLSFAVSRRSLRIRRHFGVIDARFLSGSGDSNGVSEQGPQSVEIEKDRLGREYLEARSQVFKLLDGAIRTTPNNTTRSSEDTQPVKPAKELATGEKQMSNLEIAASALARHVRLQPDRPRDRRRLPVTRYARRPSRKTSEAPGAVPARSMSVVFGDLKESLKENIRLQQEGSDRYEASLVPKVPQTESPKEDGRRFDRDNQVSLRKVARPEGRRSEAPAARPIARPREEGNQAGRRSAPSAIYREQGKQPAASPARYRDQWNQPMGRARRSGTPEKRTWEQEEDDTDDSSDGPNRFTPLYTPPDMMNLSLPLSLSPYQPFAELQYFPHDPLDVSQQLTAVRALKAAVLEEPSADVDVESLLESSNIPADSKAADVIRLAAKTLNHNYTYSSAKKLQSLKVLVFNHKKGQAALIN
mmetsp:Transcript_10954/g.17918  ORF Transcript_10954/g.17918 Transcript_10954/m.17918 type:complete len:416 (+) Transcript_10954:54-1301(+)